MKRIISLILVIAHIFTIGPTAEVFAALSSSASYRLNSGTLTEGGGERSARLVLLAQDTVGEPGTGKSQSVSFLLNSGFIPTLQLNPPQLTQPIPNQSWKPNESKVDAFDLDDYFFSPDGLSLSYTVNGNSQIEVTIDPDTHRVSFSQPENWYGTEQVTFIATDTEYNSAPSNEVSLQVEGQGNPPVLEYIADITVKETELVSITPQATDADGDEIIYTFSSPLNENGQWQTSYDDAGEYTVKVTAIDSTNLFDSQELTITVLNVNRPPVLEPIADITADEGELVTVTPIATDPDGDALTFSYSLPLDETGKWLTSYDDAGTYTVTVTAFDGIDTTSTNVNITINNVNRPPQVSLTLNKYTAAPQELITLTLSATDPDGDALIFSLKKDGQEFDSGSINDSYSTTISFSSIGDHTLSATVTDSGGLSTTDTQGVDIVDPNVNRDAINSLMGDFNGDALTDLGLHNSDTGSWEISISQEGEFMNAVDWLSGFGTSRDWWPVGGDFNGDGKADVGIYNNKTGELQVALSNGVNFSPVGTWLTASFASYSWQPLTGNFNGDSFTDFALYNKDTGEVKVALGTGSGFSAFSSWLSGFGQDYIAFGGDFNGDTLTDICLFKKSSGEFKVAFSNTASFVDGSSWISGFAIDKDALVADFNNDGLTDVGYWDKADRWYYAISTGIKFVDKGLWLENFGGSSDESAAIGDFNGDGVSDAAVFDKDEQGINRWTVKLSLQKPTDLLTEIDNGMGGKTKVTYAYAAKYDNPDLPFPVYVAASIATVDTLPADEPAETYTQLFTYSGGYYDEKEREFRGFRKVTVTDPVTANYTETYFYQGKPSEDGALKGKIEKIIAYDGNNQKISETLNTYEVKTAGGEESFLGFPALVEVTTTVWEENQTLLTTKDKFTYDNIGNITQAINEGDTSQTGDERYSFTTYAPAYDAGFNRPIEVILKDSNQNTISWRRFSEYDARGNLKKEEVWLYNPLSDSEEWLPTTYTYDSLGNLTSTTNPKGATVTTQYEKTFYTFPQTTTNALGHTIHYTYDARFGLLSSITDANGATSTTVFDSLGRVIEEKNALNQIVTTYTYPDFNTKTTTRLNLTTIEYIDGLGRRYKTISSGEDGANPRQVKTEVFYNPRGLVEKESLPHYVDEDSSKVSYLRYEYDLRGRVKKTISDFPGELKDATTSIDYISPLYTETTSPLGHKKGVRKDVFGNIVEVIEFTSGGVYHTYYEYDPQNNLIKLTDAQGNITQLFYDSLGRKLKMIDPDMGSWLYEYDKVGNLSKQTDAKEQKIFFKYDVINRLIEKSGLSSQGTVPDFSVQYLYDDTAKENCIGRLSKVVDQSGSTEFFYDKLGREIKSIKTIEGTSYTIQRSYDILDRLTSLKYPDGDVIAYTYDTNSGLLEKITNSTNATNYVNSITYNASGQITTIQYGNNTQTSYTYGQDLRLNRILTTNSTSTLQDLNYDFDLSGNLTTLTDNLTSNIRTFTYDDLDRLTQAENIPTPSGGYTTFNYQYDAIGNLTYKSDVGVMEYGQSAGPHALTQAGTTTYQYDLNGNLTQRTQQAQVTQYTYDVENRLMQVDNAGIITTFLYDGDGGRVKKSTVNSQQSTETVYIGSLYEVHQSTSAPVTSKKHIFAGSQRIATINSTDSTNSINYYHPDHLGSSHIITNENGEILQHIEYQPYGKIALNDTVDSGLSTVDYYFTGKELDSSTGLYYYGARYYDPEIGRFITADPTIQRPYDPQDLNRYAYCRNNPLKYIDPTGLGWFSKFFKKIWKAIKKPFIAAVTAAAVVLSWGAAASGTTAMAALFSKAGATVVSSAAATTATLNTGEGRQFIRRFGSEVFDDIFGMRPKAASIWANITAYMGVNTAYQFGFAQLLGANKAITKVEDITPENESIAREIIEEGRGFNYGTKPYIDPKTGAVKRASKLLYSGNEAVGVTAEALKIAGQPQHLGIVLKGLQTQSSMGSFALSQGYLSFGISHTAVNWSLLNAGYHTTITTIGGGASSMWSTLPSTFVYGPYGGGLTGAVANEQIRKL